MSAKDKESRGDQPIQVVDAEIIQRMAGGYAGPERRQGHQLREIVANEVLQLFITMVRRLEKDPTLQPKQLSEVAKKAIATYEQNRQALAHEPLLPREP